MNLPLPLLNLPLCMNLPRYGVCDALPHPHPRFISLISSLNLGGRREPQMTLQQYLSILPCLPLSSGNLQTPFPSFNGILSSHLFFCLPLHLAPFTVPCRIVFAMPEDLEMWPYHLSFRFFTMVRRSSCTPICILDSVANLLVLHMVFVGNVQKSPTASHLDFCCQGPALTGIKVWGAACRFTIYSLFMGIQNSFLDIQKGIFGYP